jgi:hypothetical protein
MALDVGATLASVAVGALISTAAAVALDRVRYRHELHVRWDIKKAEALTTYLDAVATMGRSAGHAAAHQGWDPRAATPGTLEGAIAAIEAAEARRAIAFEAVVLLANHRTIRSGHELNMALWSLEWLADGRRKGSQQVWLDDRERFQKALHTFHTAMRADLKVPGAGPSEVVVEDVTVEPEGRRLPSTSPEGDDLDLPDNRP